MYQNAPNKSEEDAKVGSSIYLENSISDIQDKVREWYQYDERSSIPADEINNTISSIIADNVDMRKMGY